MGGATRRVHGPCQRELAQIIRGHSLGRYSQPLQLPAQLSARGKLVQLRIQTGLLCFWTVLVPCRGRSQRARPAACRPVGQCMEQSGPKPIDFACFGCPFFGTALWACLCAVNCARRITSSAEAVLWMFLKIAVAKHGIIVLYVGACGSSVLQIPNSLLQEFYTRPHQHFCFIHRFAHARTHTHT